MKCTHEYIRASIGAILFACVGISKARRGDLRQPLLYQQTVTAVLVADGGAVNAVSAVPYPAADPDQLKTYGYPAQYTQAPATSNALYGAA